MINQKPSENTPVIGVLDPVAATAARTSAFVNGGRFNRLSFLVLVGAASASAAVTVLASDSSTGANTAAVKSVAVGAAANKQFRLNVSQEDMVGVSNREWYALQVAGGVAQVGVVIEGIDPKYSPTDEVSSLTDV